MSRTAEALRTGRRPAISVEEMDRRRLIVQEARHSNQLEGIEPDPDMDHIFGAFIRGEIEIDLVPRIKAVQASR